MNIKDSEYLVERIGPPIAVKSYAGSSVGEIEAYAATFNGPPDSYGDIIAPGAFAATLREHRANGTLPAMLWQHNTSAPVGVWTEFSEDAKGLRCKGKFTMDVEQARDAYALAKDGALAMSIGFRTRKASKNASGNRILEDVKLYEVSFVAIAANPSARILAVKSPIDVKTIDNPRAFEQFLRDAGFSRAFARAATAQGFKAAANLRDVEAAELADIASKMRAGSLQIRNLMTKDSNK